MHRGSKCEKLCPMNNIKIVDKKVVQNNQCTMCYRCINNCPKQAMILLASGNYCGVECDREISMMRIILLCTNGYIVCVLCVRNNYFLQKFMIQLLVKMDIFVWW